MDMLFAASVGISFLNLYGNLLIAFSSDRDTR